MPGLRVLVLDGGGARGAFTVEVLRSLERACGRPIRECFDVVVGTSIGAFIAGCIVAGLTMDAMEAAFIPLAASLGRASPSVSSLASRLVWGHVLDTREMDARLQALFGDRTLADLPDSPRLLMLAADARTITPHPFLIRSRPLPAHVSARSRFEGSSSMRLTDAFRASAAAPTIYPAHVVNGIPLVDAGILANNPVLFALAEATLLGHPLECVVSIGTGVETRTPHPSLQRGLLGWTWAAIKRSVDPETADMLAEGLVPSSQYVRIDPPGAGDCSTWEADPDTLGRWRCRVQDYMETQYERLEALADRLRPKPSAPDDNASRSVPNPGGSGC